MPMYETSTKLDICCFGRIITLKHFVFLSFKKIVQWLCCFFFFSKTHLDVLWKWLFVHGAGMCWSSTVRGAVQMLEPVLCPCQMHPMNFVHAKVVDQHQWSQFWKQMFSDCLRHLEISFKSHESDSLKLTAMPNSIWHLAQPCFESFHCPILVKKQNQIAILSWFEIKL